MQGVIVMPRRPITGSAWELREVLPRGGAAYRATVVRVWRDNDGRLVGEFIGEDGRGWECELWLQQPSEWVFSGGHGQEGD
jgi:hypothetical protein